MPPILKVATNNSNIYCLMKNIKYVWILWILFLTPLAPEANANEVLGGKLTIQYVGNRLSANPSLRCRYKISATIFRDRGNKNFTNAGPAPSSLMVGSYRKNPTGLDAYLECFNLSVSTDSACFGDLSSDTSGCDLPWYTTDCGRPFSKTPVAVRDFAMGWHEYNATISLNTTSYGSPNGYYLSSSIFGRSSFLKNVSNPTAQSVTFFLEFPSIVQNGIAFINSSPNPAIVSGKYATPRSPFSMSLGDTSGGSLPTRDVDGDSLEYALSPAFASLGGCNNPGTWTNSSQIGISNIYPSISYPTGLSPSIPIPPYNNDISNAPNIDKNGLLRFTTSSNAEGLHQVAIRVIERRFNSVSST